MRSPVLITVPGESVSILNTGAYDSDYLCRAHHDITEGETPMIETLLRSIDGRMQSMETRMQSMEARMQNLDGCLQNIDGRLDSIDGRLHTVEGQLERLTDTVGELKTRTAVIELRLTTIDESVGRIDDRQTRSDLRIDRITSDLSTMAVTIQRMPSWRGAGAIGAGVAMAGGGLVTWFANGGAKTLARLFG
jgi:hypothetical protein